MKRPFFGGVYPPYHKELSAGHTQHIRIAPKQVSIPLLQHIGAPCEPLVQVGEHVRVGQKIGDGEGLCVPVHASVSGRVLSIEERPHPAGIHALAIVIENDFQDAAVHLPLRPLEEMSGDEVLSAIREAGIVGMGGAAFPSNVKALSSMGRVDTLIANGCECEPYITADEALFCSYPESVLRGMGILARVLRAKRIVLALEENKFRAIDSLKKRMTTDLGIELAVLPARYPQGSEKQLIQAITGREVPGGKLPADVGCAVFNVSTFAAIERALCEGEALTRRIVTVSGEAVSKPQNIIAPIGTSFRDLIEAAGGLSDQAERVISGGPMMGVTQSDLSVPVVKATNAILCLPRNEDPASEHPVCIRCGKCVEVCPVLLQPLYLYRYERADHLKKLEQLNLMDCIECGSCSFICPGKLPLVERIRKGKQKLREAKAK